MHPLSQFATGVAPHVDRLVLAVHRQMRTVHGDAVDQWRADTGLARPGLLINLRPFFLAGTQSLALLERLHRYALPATFEESLRDAIGEGLIDDSLTPSDRCLELSIRLTALQASLIDEMWDDQSGISPLVNPLRAAVEGIPKRYPGPGFTLARAWANLPQPDDSEPFLIHHLLTALRYLRADSHSVVLDAAGLSAGEAARLDAVWRQLEGSHHDHPLDGLVRRGLLDPDGNITEDGQHARAAIEDETNSVSGAAWEAVAAEELPEVLVRLEALPDHVRS